jgi:hypothetical protein
LPTLLIISLKVVPLSIAHGQYLGLIIASCFRGRAIDRGKGEMGEMREENKGEGRGKEIQNKE